MSDTNLMLVRRGYEALGRGDFDALGAILATDVRWHGGDRSAAGACQNRDQALRFIRQAHDRGRVGELLDVVAAGDQVVVILQPAGQGGELLAPVANLTTIRDGMVVEMVHYADPREAFLAAGIAAPPGLFRGEDRPLRPTAD